MNSIPIISRVPQEICLNQAYNELVELDENDVPAECRLHSRSLDDTPARFGDEDDQHAEYESLIHKLYVQGVKAIQF